MKYDKRARITYIGAYSGRNSAGGGIRYPGRIAMGGPNWTVYPGPKINHITINRRGPLCVGESAVGQNGGPVCGDGN